MLRLDEAPAIEVPAAKRAEPGSAGEPGCRPPRRPWQNALFALTGEPVGGRCRGPAAEDRTEISTVE
jgi:hypothetical protein